MQKNIATILPNWKTSALRMEQDCCKVAILCVNCIKLAASLLSFPPPARALSINCDMCGAYVGYGGINYHYELLWLHRNTPPASYLENVSTWTKIFPIFPQPRHNTAEKHLKSFLKFPNLEYWVTPIIDLLNFAGIGFQKLWKLCEEAVQKCE